MITKSGIAKVAPCAPAVTDDVAMGFGVGDVWYNSNSGILYRCMDCSLGSAVWNSIGEVTPTPDGPKIIVPDKPKHLVDLEQKLIDDTKKQMLAESVGTITYADHSDDQLPTWGSPEAQDDVAKAMAKKIQEEVDKELVETIIDCPDTVGVVMTELGQPDKNGNVYGKSPIHKVMSDVAYMQAKLNQALSIPPHLLQGPVLDTK